ncbi:hypothetical protein J6590_001535 [Homalodisca vitripennis]|nr:hypothetical protein J6590_001535 [Homalodisca vitripennis]
MNISDHNLLHSALLSAASLQRLILQNIASDSILTVVGSACKNLTVLDVAHSRQVTDAGLRQLFLQVEIRDKTQTTRCGTNVKGKLKTMRWSCLRKLLRPFSNLGFSRNSETKLADVSFLLEYCESRNPLCKSLRVLNIANTAVTSAGVLLALRSAPGIHSLGDYCHMGRALEVYERVCGPGNLPEFHLRSARSSRTNLHRLELLSSACPELQRLSLSEPHHTPESLSLLPMTLTSLSLHGVPNSPIWVAKLLKFFEGPHGRNLKELVIRFFLPEFLTQIDLGSVLKNCTNLQSLVLDGANVDWLTDGELRLTELENIHLGKSVTAKAVTNLMKCAPNLARVHFFSCLDLTDDHLLKIRHPYLQCFYIYEASCISAETINTLLANCVNLQSTGNLSNWGLSCDAMRSVVSLIQDNNFQLQLNGGSHWFSPCFPCINQY